MGKFQIVGAMSTSLQLQFDVSVHMTISVSRRIARLS